jgi:hypothetical protein
MSATQSDGDEAQLTEDEFDLLRANGASDATIRMCRQSVEGLFRDDDLPVDRHSVRQECIKYVRGRNEDHDAPLTQETVDSFSQYGGGFFSKIWDGDLHGAYAHADPNNVALMEEVFNVGEINRTRNESWKQTVSY